MFKFIEHQGFVRPTSAEIPISDDDPLPSIDLDSLQSEVSQPEVALAFHLPLSELTAPSRMRSHLFRDERPYTVLDVTDFVQAGAGGEVSITAASNEKGEVSGKKEGRIEVWGLTGWYLSLLMKTLRIYP
jgi:nudix motif 8